MKKEKTKQPDLPLSIDYIKGFIDGYLISRKEKLEYLCYKSKVSQEDLEYILSGHFEKTTYLAFDNLYNFIKKEKT